MWHPVLLLLGGHVPLPLLAFRAKLLFSHRFETEKQVGRVTRLVTRLVARLVTRLDRWPAWNPYLLLFLALVECAKKWPPPCFHLFFCVTSDTGEVIALLTSIATHPLWSVKAISVHHLFITKPSHFKPNLVFCLNVAHKTLPAKARKGIGMVVWIQFNRFIHSKIDNHQAGHNQAGHLSLGLAQPLFGISWNLFTVMFYRLMVTICNVNDMKQTGQKVTRSTNNRWPGLRAARSPGHLVVYTAGIWYYRPGLTFPWGICS